MFDDLPVDVLEDLARRVELMRVRRGAKVVVQGERADAYFIVRSGRLEVSDQADDEEPRVLRTLQAGDGFGELGLATGAPRAATVRALTSAELFVLDKGTFERLLLELIRLPEVEPTVQTLAEVRALASFAHLDAAELRRLLEHGRWRAVAPGEEVVTQGQVGDTFYAVESGHLEVVRDGVVTQAVRAGGHFGEVALLLDQPRAATVRAVTPSRVFELQRAGFDALLRDGFRSGHLKPNAALDRSWEH
jgi:CRP-like cAMP-binding protein